MKRFTLHQRSPLPSFSILWNLLILFGISAIISCQENTPKEKTAEAPIVQQHLLVVNRSSHSVSLINTAEQKLVKNIPVGIGPHEISVSKDNRFAFVANYGSYPKPHEDPITPQQLEWMEDSQNSITKIDLQDLSTQTFTIPESFSPHGVLSNQDGSKVWITDENAGLIREIDGNSGTILKEYKTMTGSHIIKSNQDFSSLFVSNIESNTVSVINMENQEVSNISTPKGPEGMGVCIEDNLLWVLCNNANEIMIIDVKSLKPVKTFDSQGKFPVKIAFIGKEAWVVNVFSHNIAIFDAYTFAFKESIDLESSPLGIIADEEKVYITLPRLNKVQVYDYKTRQKVLDYPHGMEQDGMEIIEGVGP